MIPSIAKSRINSQTEFPVWCNGANITKGGAYYRTERKSPFGETPPVIARFNTLAALKASL